jgi:hypothetical protein
MTFLERHMRRDVLLKRTLTVLAGGLATIALSCSSTDDDPTFDSSGGNDLARELLPEANVLPGSGWTFEETDPDDGDDEDEGLAGLCGALEEGLADLEEEVGEAAGKAAGTYTLPGDEDDPSALGVEVQAEVEIHEDSDSVRRGLDLFDEIVSSEEFDQCIEEAFNEGAAEGESPEGLEVTFETVEPSADAPRDGTEKAFKGQVALGAISVELAAAED